LGYPASLPELHNTHDVDGILTLNWLKPPETHEDFWQAVQQTNIELEADGLYLTHLFREVDVILQSDWVNRRVPLYLKLEHLVVYRPAAIDLVLTKMARGDAEDLSDIGFLIQQEPITQEQLKTAFERARVPDVSEIQRIFRQAQPRVLAMARG
jgi:hypothetical protein